MCADRASPNAGVMANRDAVKGNLGDAETFDARGAARRGLFDAPFLAAHCARESP